MVVGHLHPYEIGLLKRLVFRTQLYLSHDKPLVVAIKLVYLESVTATLHQITSLVYHARLTQPKQMFGLLHRDLFLKLIARHATIVRRSFDGEECLITAHTYPDSRSPSGDIALTDATARMGAAFEIPVFMH